MCQGVFLLMQIVEGGPAGTCASVTMDDIYIGNGVSELIMMSMRALLNPGDEVLIPSPDYPLWTAAVLLHGGVPVYYDCPSDNGFLPQIENIRSLVTARTRAIVIVNPNNPTGVIYPEELLQDIADMAEVRMRRRVGISGLHMDEPRCKRQGLIAAIIGYLRQAKKTVAFVYEGAEMGKGEKLACKTGELGFEAGC